MQLSTGSKAFLVVLVLAAGAVVGGLYALVAADNDAEPEATSTATIEVTEGMGVGEVAVILEEAGIIERAWAFRLSARFDDRASRIRPGTYDLDSSMDTGDILQVLSEGEPLPETFRFTVPEGLTVGATLERIADADGSPFTVADLEEALVAVAMPEWVPVDDLPSGAQIYEGLLFPATYDFFIDQDAQHVVGQMITKTESELDRIDEPEHLSRYEVLVVASMIEREVRVAEERAVVSSVISNRLEAGMRLQVDATVLYARGEHTGRLLFEDLAIDSAWNTYEVGGLPPTPIAAPGRAAIEAAAQPADSDYHYYVVCDTSTGEHAFARSSEEHQANVAQYRQIQEDGGRFCDE